MSNKIELVVGALQQRIGELVSNYETNIAVLRAEITQLAEEIQVLKSKKEPEKEIKE